VLIPSTFQRGQKPKIAVKRATAATTNAIILSPPAMGANTPTKTAAIPRINLRILSIPPTFFVIYGLLSLNDSVTSTWSISSSVSHHM
jgi:hypothetical protein